MNARLVELEADHPGFHDVEYRARRDRIARLALEHPGGAPPPRVDYSPSEVATWGTVFRALSALHPTHACDEYLGVLPELGFGADAIPQLADVDAVLARRTGFHLRPVAGLVNPRDFLGALARRVFLCTQYIRHGSVPHYTPEPDVVHELLGHAAMLAIPEFADLSQEIGVGALGVPTEREDEIEALSRLYWYTVEFGLVRQHGGVRAYGAGLLSSFGELERAVRGDADVRPFDAAEAAARPFPITTYQPVLYVVESLREAFERTRVYLAARPR